MNTDELNQIGDFLMEHDSTYLSYQPGMLEKYLGFYDSRGAMGRLLHVEQVVGVGLARPVQLCRLQENYPGTIWDFDEAGADTLFIQEIAVTHCSLIPILWSMMVDRFGPRKYVAGLRHGILRHWLFKRYENKVNQILILK